MMASIADEGHELATHSSSEGLQLDEAFLEGVTRCHRIRIGKFGFRAPSVAASFSAGLESLFGDTVGLPRWSRLGDAPSDGPMSTHGRACLGGYPEMLIRRGRNFTRQHGSIQVFVFGTRLA